jgi:hypothetical protein
MRIHYSLTAFSTECGWSDVAVSQSVEAHIGKGYTSQADREATIPRSGSD